VLLTSSGRCRRCGGAGRNGAAAETAADEPGSCVRTFDEQGRVITETWPARSLTCRYFDA